MPHLPWEHPFTQAPRQQVGLMESRGSEKDNDLLLKLLCSFPEASFSTSLPDVTPVSFLSPPLSVHKKSYFLPNKKLQNI